LRCLSSIQSDWPGSSPGGLCLPRLSLIAP
jgi:hypothetical protein